MRKLLLLPILLLLVACGSAAAPQETTVSERSDADKAAAPAETAGVGSSEEETGETDPVQDGNGSVATGTTPEEASIVREQDHTKGTDDPTVTIIEYGDFQ